MNPVRIFISYSWDSTEHKDWVRKLADSLEEIEELHVTWDGYDLDSLVDKNYFMEAGIHDADLILVVTTSKYKTKADDRTGGVGLETFLTSAIHWDSMLREKKSKLILINREPNSTPRYLVGNFHIDFSDELNYARRVEELLNLIRGTATIERPKKKRGISTKDHIYEFTRVEELIRVNHPNRKAIVSVSDGTDFSGTNRVKYEIWETRSPALGYFLALHANINIHQTAQHAVEKLVFAKIRPTDLTVLRQRAGRPEQNIIRAAFASAKLSIRIHECTYKEYIWEYCIDETLKTIDPPTTIENYTDQSLSFTNPDTGDLTRMDSAVNHIAEALQKPSDIAAHLVVAPGGMGKTSLCLSVAKKLHNRKDLGSSVILIQAEAIKKYIADKGVVQSRIETIYDIYELYAKYQGHGKLFERSTFDLAVVCGNLTIIIDGLDELSSLFQDKFDASAFLESLKQLHDQLGSSNILLTTRNNVVAADAKLDDLSIARYDLLGFDAESCRKYVTRRLQGYTNGSALIQKTMGRIAKVRIQDYEGRIVPFLADIATTVVEDELTEGNEKNFDLNDDYTPYPSNNQLTDHIVYSILRREETRHELDISISEVLEIITSLVIDYGKRWPASEIENRLQLLYESRAQTIFAKLQLNPLLLTQNGDIELRYSFLSSYFEVLFMLQGILRGSLETETSRSLARLSPDSEEARELRRYFSGHMGEVEEALKLMLPKLRNRAAVVDTSKTSVIDREYAKGSIATLLQLFFSTQKLPIDVVTCKLLAFYGISEDNTDTRTLDGLYIRGDFPPLDFTNLIVTNSRFQGYKNFLSSRFLNSKFMYSVFEDCSESDFINSSLDPKMIDPTCDSGGLRDAFLLAKATKADERAMIQAEAVRFLHSFFKGDRFVDNKTAHVKFSTKVPGLAPDKFDRLIANNYFRLVRDKTIASFYEISTDFKPSVRRLLTDGYPDGRMKQFLGFIR